MNKLYQPAPGKFVVIITKTLPQLNELPGGIQDWFAKGQMVDVLGRQMFVIEQVTNCSSVVNNCIS